MRKQCCSRIPRESLYTKVASPSGSMIACALHASSTQNIVKGSFLCDCPGRTVGVIRTLAYCLRVAGLIVSVHILSVSSHFVASVASLVLPVDKYEMTSTTTENVSHRYSSPLSRSLTHHSRSPYHLNKHWALVTPCFPVHQCQCTDLIFLRGKLSPASFVAGDQQVFGPSRVRTHGRKGSWATGKSLRQLLKLANQRVGGDPYNPVPLTATSLKRPLDDTFSVERTSENTGSGSRDLDSSDVKLQPDWSRPGEGWLIVR